MDRGSRRGASGSAGWLEALAGYYGQDADGHGWYTARLGRDDTGAEIATSVLTSPDWLDLDCPLTKAMTGSRSPRGADGPPLDAGCERRRPAARRDAARGHPVHGIAPVPAGWHRHRRGKIGGSLAVAHSPPTH